MLGEAGSVRRRGESSIARMSGRGTSGADFLLRNVENALPEGELERKLEEKLGAGYRNGRDEKTVSVISS